MPRLILFLALGLLSLASLAQGLSTREEAILMRLAPIGEVCMAGEACAATALASASSGPQSAEDIYNTFCMACHVTGASNAPLLGNTEMWAERIAKGREALYQSVFDGIEVEGVYVMPQRGLCLNCSDEELMATVDYMVEQSQ